MYIVATFNYSLHLEMFISALEQEGIDNNKILTIPLSTKNKKIMTFETMTHLDGITPLDMPAVLGTLFMVFGAIYGYMLKWGPVIWGLIGLFAGGLIGYLFHIIPKTKGKNSKIPYGALSADVVVIIHCDPSKSELLERLVDIHNALGIGKLDKEG